MEIFVNEFASWTELEVDADELSTAIDKASVRVAVTVHRSRSIPDFGCIAHGDLMLVSPKADGAGREGSRGRG